MTHICALSGGAHHYGFTIQEDQEIWWCSEKHFWLVSGRAANLLNRERLLLEFHPHYLEQLTAP